MFGGTLNELKLDQIDFDWVEQQTKSKFLKKAIKLIEDDGNYFQDLKNACLKRLETIDPSALPKDFKSINNVSQKEKEEIDADMQKFKETMESSNIQANYDRAKAENEKNKGNEAIKTKDYKEALQYYTQSINLDPSLAASYCNRALVYLKLEKYEDCIRDANKALELQPNYVRALHRRAKAFQAQKRYNSAFNDFQEIMALDPQNNEVNADLRDLQELMQKEKKETDFKKVQIVEEESSDEEIQQQNKDEVIIKDENTNTEVQKMQFQPEITESNLQNELDLLESINDSITQTRQQIKNAQYEQVIQVLLPKLTLIDSLKTLLKCNPDDFYKTKAKILSNLTLCYKQIENTKEVIKHASSLIQLQKHVEQQIILKAYLRRALAYESEEKYQHAKNDLQNVKKIEPSHKVASEALRRIMNFANEQEPVPQEVIEEQEKQLTIEQINELKVSGNKFFKEKNFLQAKQHYIIGYTNLLSGFSKQIDQQDNEKLTILNSFLNNLAFVEQNLKEYKNCIKTCDECISYDNKNIKAWYRKGTANLYLSQLEQLNTQQDYEISISYLSKAVENFQKAKELDPNNKDIWTELNKAQINLQQRKKDLEEIKVMGKTENGKTENGKTEKIEEKQAERQEKLTVEEVKQLQKKVKQDNSVPLNTKEIAELANKNQINKLIQDKTAPKNNSEVLKLFKLFNNKSQKLFEYLSVLDQSIFTKLSFESDSFLQIIESFKEIERQLYIYISNKFEIAHNIIQSLTKNKGFSLNVQFFSKKEKQSINEILERVQLDQGLKIIILLKIDQMELAKPKNTFLTAMEANWNTFGTPEKQTGLQTYKSRKNEQFHHDFQNFSQQCQQTLNQNLFHMYQQGPRKSGWDNNELDEVIKRQQLNRILSNNTPQISPQQAIEIQHTDKILQLKYFTKIFTMLLFIIICLVVIFFVFFDVQNKWESMRAVKQIQIDQCRDDYFANGCDNLVSKGEIFIQLCVDLNICMNWNTSVQVLKITAITHLFGEVLTEFVEPLEYKTLAFLAFLIIIFLKYVFTGEKYTKIE